MAVLIFLPDKNDPGRRLHKILKDALSGREANLCCSIDELSGCLRMDLNHYRIAVLYLKTRRDLLNILPFGNLFEDVKLILILPDGDPLTVSQAHRLRPRFITYIDNPFKDLGMVLKQMVRLYDDNEISNEQINKTIKKQKQLSQRQSALAKKGVLL